MAKKTLGAMARWNAKKRVMKAKQRAEKGVAIAADCLPGEQWLAVPGHDQGARSAVYVLRQDVPELRLQQSRLLIALSV